MQRYAGVDISPGNIALFRKKILDGGLTNVHAFVGDATKLDTVESHAYDIVLAFGPMYHLPPDEAELAFAECRRICRPDGIVMVSYINKVGVYIGACLNHPDAYPNSEKNKSILQLGIDDTRDSIYWFHMPEDMEKAAARHGMTVLENLGVDFVFMPDLYSQPLDKKGAWKEVANFLCNSPSCTGFSNHAVMVCRNGI